MNRIVFNNMNTDIYGDWKPSSGKTYFTKHDMLRAVITRNSNVTIITIDGEKHFVEYDTKLKEFLK